LVDWTGEFDAWYDRLIARASKGNARAVMQLGKLDAAFTVLGNLTSPRRRPRTRPR
jgi:hypothetical protein